MKRKKNRFISIISSLFGIAALCGIFSLTSLSNRTVDETKADNTLVLYQSGISQNYTDDDFTFNIVGSWRYLETYSFGTQNYQFEVRIKIYGSGTYNNYFGNYYVANNINAQSVEELVFYSNIYNESTTNFTFMLNAISEDEDHDYYNFYFEFGLNESHRLDKYVLPLSNGNYSGWNILNEGFDDIGDLQLEIVSTDFVMDSTGYYDLGYSDGYTSGYNDGYQNGNTTGYNNGYQQGYNTGVTDTQQEYDLLVSQAYQQGYSAGYEQGNTQDQTVSTIFSGIMSVAMVPVDFFLAIFNFEILGINISAMVTALLSLAITIVVIKLVMGKKGE